MNVNHELCCVVALYGVKLEPNGLKELYEQTLRWFAAIDVSPDKLALRTFGKKRADFRSFSRSHAKLRSSGFEDLEDFSIYGLAPGGDHVLWHWRTASDYSASTNHFVFGAWASLASFESPTLIDFTHRFVQMLAPDYGIGFNRTMKLGPTLYAIGLAQGLNLFEERDKVERVNAWGSAGIEGKIFRNGILRDLYPWNLLTKMQLDRLVGQVSLKSWIEADSERGTISPMSDTMWLWKLTESQIVAVRPILENAGLIWDGQRVRGGQYL